jgi:beta-lactamase superfamily II metal-dependent hydrolase
MQPPSCLRSRFALLAAGALALGAVLAPAPASALFMNGKLQVIHLDAGQGDGAVIITPGGQVALIDEGTNFTAGSSPPSCSRVLSELQALGVTHVDLHFASHYHADHIGCITSLTGITIDEGWDRGASYSSAAYTNYVNYLGAKRHTLSKGQVFTLDAGSAHPVTITCVALAGDGISTSDENSKCVVLKVSYGAFDEVLGGDLTGYPSGTSSSDTNIETQVGPQVGPVEVYKVHHHGSAYGSYDDWLNATTPKVGIISCGTGNGYGHPTLAALTRLHNHSVHTYWTETGAGAAPNPAWDKVANDEIRINAVWQPGGVDSVLAPGIADAFTNSDVADAIAPAATVLSPNGGETLAAGGAASLLWSASDNVGVTSIDLEYSLDHGGHWSPLALGIGNAGTWGWSVPNVVSLQALVRVTARDAAGNPGSDVSNADFAIADQTAPTVAVTAPNGGESYAPLSSQSITWNAADNIGVSSIDVDYSVHGAAGPWVAIQHGIANSGSISWQVPGAASDSVLVRVAAFDQALNLQTDVSNALFQIAASPLGVGDGLAPRLALLPPVPSPGSGVVTLRYSLAAPGSARIQVLDVRGREVWRAEQSGLAAGGHQVSWSGLDHRNAAVGTGIYFVRLTAGAQTRTVKLVMLR